MSKNQQDTFGNPPNAMLKISCTQNTFNGIRFCNPKTLQSLTVIGLCINCDRIDYCIWQENNKVACEHYQ